MMDGVEGRRDCCWVFEIGPARLDTERLAESGAEEWRRLMTSSCYCRHCDADGHHTTVDTGIWFLRDTVTMCRLAGIETVSQPQVICVVFLFRRLA